MTVFCSVLLPTFRRPEGLRRAARSVFAQRTDFSVELVVVDNSPEYGARDVLTALQAEAPIPVRSAHERRAGIAFARNALVRSAQGEVLAWLDDDQEATQGWLAALVSTLRAQHADVAFGPVRAIAPPVRHREVYEKLYARLGASSDSLIATPLGIGNCVMRAMHLDDYAPFDVATNETGGEDDRLFDRLAAANARFAWSAQAWVNEHIAPSRLNPQHALKRAFAYGQGPSERAVATNNLGALAQHVSIGTAQALAYGTIAACAALAHSDAALSLAERAARGAGKALWFLPQKFYGVAASSPA